MAKKPAWAGVFPAVTTQFRADFSLDIEATRKVAAALVAEGVSGLIAVGTVGENNSLTRAEKLQVMEALKDAAGSRVPVIAGVAEYTTAFACEVAKEAQRLRIDGLMVLPAMVYSAKPRETLAHFRTVAKATDLPIMIYNNPPIYKQDVTPKMLASLADVDTIVSYKESSGDTFRFVDLRNMTGDRFIPFCGLDDVVVESVALGAQGWVSGLSNVFPREGETLFRLAAAGRLNEVMPLY
ncbi:MAG: dihydrodipicolinate synthase family protein, partial [Hyphomicrobiales bacterium]|nr:dihydrodipicolinate synthase family protein [Hyphomicrobiales bacterium]